MLVNDQHAGVILSAILIEVIGRKLNIAFTTFGSAISILPLFYCGLAKYVPIV